MASNFGCCVQEEQREGNSSSQPIVSESHLPPLSALSPSTSCIHLCSIFMWTDLNKCRCKCSVKMIWIVFESRIQSNPIQFSIQFSCFFHQILKAPSCAISFFWQYYAFVLSVIVFSQKPNLKMNAFAGNKKKDWENGNNMQPENCAIAHGKMGRHNSCQS